MLRPLDILVVLKIQAINDVWKQGNHGFGGGGGSGGGFGDGTGFGGPIDEARKNLREAVEMVLEANRVLSEESMPMENVIKEDFILYEAS